MGHEVYGEIVLLGSNFIHSEGSNNEDQGSARQPSLHGRPEGYSIYKPGMKVKFFLPKLATKLKTSAGNSNIFSIMSRMRVRLILTSFDLSFLRGRTQILYNWLYITVQ